MQAKNVKLRKARKMETWKTRKAGLKKYKKKNTKLGKL